mgnify:CR=1 FL=1
MDQKNQKAWNILEELKSYLMDILWTDDKFDYNNEHFMIPWIQEEAEYKIKKLNLSATSEEYFMIKIHQIVGEYMEDV